MGRFGRIPAVGYDKSGFEIVYPGGVAQVNECLYGKRHGVVFIFAHLIDIHDGFCACAHACEIEPVFTAQNIFLFKCRADILVYLPRTVSNGKGNLQAETCLSLLIDYRWSIILGVGRVVQLIEQLVGVACGYFRCEVERIAD